MEKSKHISVLLNESIEALNIKEDGVYVDGTLGGGGHSIEIVKKLGQGGKLIGIDQDSLAIGKSKERLKDYLDKVIFVEDNYVNLDKILDSLGIDKIDGILLDIGVSSFQLDIGERGFSYHEESRLDMRMDQTAPLTAWDVVNNYNRDELTRILRDYGEEKWASRISEFIVREREKKPIDTTLELVEVIKMAIPAGARREGPHPARRTFQAIRIEVNKELEVLSKIIPKAVKRLRPGGRIAIITFHSLEDRIVKNTFRELNKSCICPKELPFCVCDKVSELEIITRKPILASKEEVQLNSRSRSAKLRVGEKL